MVAFAWPPMTGTVTYACRGDTEGVREGGRAHAVEGRDAEEAAGS
jgi:hypothetical protein